METVFTSIVFIVGLVGGFIGTIVGGAGLMIVPALIFLGASPHVAVATSRFGLTGIPITGIFAFNKGGKVDYRIGIPVALSGIAGAFVGSNMMLSLSEVFLEKLLGACILFILIFIIVNKHFGLKPKRKNGALRSFFGYVCFFFIGAWAAIIGGGGAVLANMVLIGVFGLSFLESAGTRKLQTLGASLMALSVYIYHDTVHWTYGIALLLGAMIGSHIGAHHAMKKGDGWVRKLFIVFVGVSAVKLLV